jgi:hypothetical protein
MKRDDFESTFNSFRKAAAAAFPLADGHKLSQLYRREEYVARSLVELAPKVGEPLIDILQQLATLLIKRARRRINKDGDEGELESAILAEGEYFVEIMCLVEREAPGVLGNPDDHDDLYMDFYKAAAKTYLATAQTAAANAIDQLWKRLRTLPGQSRDG